MKTRLKRMISAVTLLAVAAALTAGCSTKSPREILKSAIQKNSAATSNTASGEILLSYPSAKTGDVIQETVKATFSGAFQKNPELGMLNMSMSIQDISFNVDVYTKDEKLWIKLPMTSAYLLLNPEELSQKAGNEYDVEKQHKLRQKFWQELYVSFIDSLPSDSIALEPNKKVHDEMDVDMVVLDLNNRAVGSFIETAVNMLSESEFREMNIVLYGIQDDKSYGIHEAQDIQQMLNKFKEHIKIHKLNIRIGVDKQGYIRHQEILAEFESSIETSINGKVFDIHAVIKTDNINRQQQFDFPDFSKLEVIPLDQI